MNKRPAVAFLRQARVDWFIGKSKEIRSRLLKRLRDNYRPLVDHTNNRNVHPRRRRQRFALLRIRRVKRKAVAGKKLRSGEFSRRRLVAGG